MTARVLPLVLIAAILCAAATAKIPRVGAAQAQRPGGPHGQRASGHSGLTRPGKAAHLSSYWILERRYVRQQHALGRVNRTVRRLRAQSAARTLQAVGSSSLERSFLCIYSGENGGYGWAAETGNGFHGGLQMDSEFERSYGPEFVRAWGHASNWPEAVQITVAIRAWLSGRGFAPWPVTSRACGLR